MNTQKVFSISDGVSVLGFQNRCKPYVVGFKTRNQAETLSRLYNPLKELNVIRGRIESVTDEVAQGLKSLGVSWKNGDITIDTEAILEFPLKTEDMRTKMHDAPSYKVYEYEYNEFITLPFTSNVGVALPIEVIQKDKLQLSFTTYIIDPCESYDYYRKNMDKIFHI